MEHQNEHRMEFPIWRGVSRVEVLDGPTGRRRWSDDVKARIVAESLLPGVRVCDVAAKYGLIARHLSQWRGLARQGKLVLPVDNGLSFVPLMVEPAATPAPVGPMTEAELGFAPKSGVMVVFRSKRGDRVKVLFWDGSGIVPLGDEDIACRAMDDLQAAGTGWLCLAEGWRWGHASVAGAV